MKKILIISPTPTHPQNAGNRSRIYNLSVLLRKYNFDVHFLFIEYESSALQAMRDFWGEKLHVISDPFAPIPPKLDKVSRIKNKLKWVRFRLKKLYYSFVYSELQVKYNGFVDDHYSYKMDKVATELQAKFKFDTVIVEYVYLSRVLLAFDKKVFKVIDTLDILTDRFKIYLEKGLDPQWYSMFAKEESKGLDRADVCLAIQEQEKEKLKKLTSKEVVLFGHNTIVDKDSLSIQPFAKKLLFVASENFINVNGINHFIERVLPKIKVQHPDVQVKLGGSIVNVRSSVLKDSAITFLGEMENIGDAYSDADIVINPILIGTGLKIKTIEALSYGKPLVTFLPGVAGLSHIVDFEYCLTSENDQFFASNTILLLNNGQKREELKISALKFAYIYNQISSEELIEKISAQK